MAKNPFRNVTAQYLAFALAIASVARGAKAADAPAAPARPAAIPVVDAAPAINPDEFLVAEMKNFEDFRAVSYKDGKVIDPKTHEVVPGESIYYGHQLRPGENLPNLTRAQAEVLLRKDLARHKKVVTDWAAEHNVKLTAAQMTGLTALVFNVGPKPLYGTIGSRLRAGDTEGAAAAFMQWDKMHDGAGNLVVSSYQRERRKTDVAIFKGDWVAAQQGIDWADVHNHGLPKKTIAKTKSPSKS